MGEGGRQIVPEDRRDCHFAAESELERPSEQTHPDADAMKPANRWDDGAQPQKGDCVCLDANIEVSEPRRRQQRPKDNILHMGLLNIHRLDILDTQVKVY